MLLGELSLDGTIEPINGVLPMVYTALEHGCNYCIVPADNMKKKLRSWERESGLLECICFQKSLIFWKMLRTSM